MAPSVCLDSSAIVWVLLQDSPELVSAFNDLLVGGGIIVAPDLVHYEVVNSLWKYVRAGAIDGDQCRTVLAAFLGLPIQLADDDQLHLDASALANRSVGLTGYDAHFIVLAQRTQAALWTCDRGLAALATQSGVTTKLWSAATDPVKG